MKLISILILIFINISLINTNDDESLLLAKINENTKLNVINDVCTKPLILINTIDGDLHVFEVNDLNKDFKKLWSINLSNTMISSSLDKLELYNEDNSLTRIIPSLDGTLFKYFEVNNQKTSLNSDYIERIPLNMDDLLKTSIKLNNKITFIGGLMTKTIGINIQNGQIVYNCSSIGCETKTSANHNVDNLIVVKQSSYLLRAIMIENGNEMWNISLIKNEILSYPTCNSNIKNDFDTTYKNKYSLNLIENIEQQLRFDISKGIFKFKNNNKKQQKDLNKPIVSTEMYFNGVSKQINIFQSIYNQQRFKSNKNTDLINAKSASTIFIGKYDKQYYAQYNNLHLTNLMGLNKDNLLINNHLYDKKLLKTKSTIPNYNKENDEKNSLILYKNENFFDNSNNDIDSNDNLDGDSGNSDSFGGWFFIEYNNMPNLNYIHMIFTFKQMFLFLITLFAILIATYFILIKKNLLHSQLSKTTLARAKTTSTVLHQVPSTPTQSTNTTISKQTSVNTSNQYSNDNANIVFDLNDIDNELNLDDEYQSRYLTEFQHVRLIGRGGFGFVFEAKHRIDERVFAIKRIKLKNKQSAKEKVLREVRTLAKLESPYIVRYFHSWFEYPPVEWQKKIDNVLLKKCSSNNNNNALSITSSQITTMTGVSSSINETTSNNTDEIKYKGLQTSNSATSFIEFEYSNSNKTNNGWTDDEISKTHKKDESDSSSFIVFDGSNKNNDDWNDDEDDDAESNDGFNKIKLSKSSKNESIYIYIQMELCQRETLRHWIDLYKYGNRQRFQIAIIIEQILHAISYIHSKDLIHRDLKPSNIFLSLDGKMIKIGDFGLVVSAEKQVDEDDVNTSDNNDQTKNTKKTVRSNDGTYDYMSPEQRSGHDYNNKVDIYSLGIIIFELIVSFDTQMERIQNLNNLNKQIFPVNFARDYIIEKELIRLLIDVNPNNRPSAAQIFELDLYKDFQEMYSESQND